MSQKTVEVKLSENPVVLNPGDSRTIDITLENIGPHMENFKISVKNINPDWVTIEPDRWRIYSKYDSQEIFQRSSKLTISIPSSEEGGKYYPEIEVFSEDQEEVVESYPFSVDVIEKKLPTVTLTLRPDSQRNNKRLFPFALTLLNDTDQLLDINLTAISNDNDRLKFRISPDKLKLQRHTKRTASVEIETPRRNWVGADRTYNFEITTEGFGETNGQFIQSCILPWTRRVLLNSVLRSIALLIPLMLIVSLVVFWPKSQPTNKGSPLKQK